MFLINDNEAKVGKWGKDGAPGTDRDPSLPALQAHPLLPALGIGQVAVQHGDPRSPSTRMIEPRPETLHCLGSEGNLRNQDDGAFPRLEHRAKSAEIDLRLAAPGHPAQKERNPGIARG